jgi:hypothetical protein
LAITGMSAEISSAGSLDVVGDPAEQQRDVVEQVVRGEDAVGLERDARGDALQPAAGEVGARVAQAARQGRREWAGKRRVHAAT